MPLAAACTEDGPDIAAVPDTEPGDPAVYAPDGWPLQIGNVVSYSRELELQKEFLRYGNITAMHLVGDQVYGACWGSENGERTYAGHCPKKASWDRGTVAERESVLPERFRGRIEYRPPPWFVRFDEATGEPYVVPEYTTEYGRWTEELIRSGERYHEERIRR